jgi:hypothetical protein
MKITETLLRSIIRDLLQEEVYGAMAFVYTGSQSPPDVFIPLIVEDNLEPGKGKGGLYGKGLYTVYDLPGTQTEKGFYGNYIYKLAVNLHGYICFDKDVATKVYGKPLTIIQQMELLGLDDEIIETCKAILEQVPLTGRLTAPTAQPISLQLRGIVKGLVFTGQHDGQVAVVYDASTVTPIAYRTVKAKLWKKVSKDIRAKSVGRTQTDWRKERYETNTFEKFKRVKAKLARFKHLGQNPSPEDLIVDGDLDLSGGQSMGLKAGMAGPGTTEIPAGLHVKGTLVVHPDTTVLPPGLRVDGNLPLYSTQVTEIPDGLVVGKNLMLPQGTTRIGSGVRAGSLYGGSSAITELPPDIVIGGDINLENSQVTRLPDNLTVNGSLTLTSTPIRQLPSGLHVTGDLDIRKTPIEELPDDLQVDDGVKVSYSFPYYKIPRHLANGRRKDGTKKVWSL